MTLITPSRVAKAEARYTATERANKQQAEQAQMRYSAEHAASEQQATSARMAVTFAYRDLSVGLSWFKSEWQDALPRTIHTLDTEPQDVFGGPAYSARFRSYMFEDGDETHEPVRMAMRSMARSSSLFDRCGALFLFVLACQDFKLEDAGHAMGGHCLCIERDAEGRPVGSPHGRHCKQGTQPITREYVGWYAEKAIDRLREKVLDQMRRKPQPVDEPEWHKRLGKSESQAMAEASP